MKIKLLFIGVIFLLCGCSYREINNLSIVTGIGIDFDNELYQVNLITVDTNKSSDSIESNVISGEGNSLKKTFSDLNKIDPKDKYYGHVLLLVISEDAYKKIDEITDYIKKHPQIPHNFYIFITDCFIDDVFEILSSNSLEKNYFKELNGTLYSNFYTKYINKKKIKLPYLTIEDDEIKVGGRI